MKKIPKINGMSIGGGLSGQIPGSQEEQIKSAERSRAAQNELMDTVGQMPDSVSSTKQLKSEQTEPEGAVYANQISETPNEFLDIFNAYNTEKGLGYNTFLDFQTGRNEADWRDFMGYANELGAWYNPELLTNEAAFRKWWEEAPVVEDLAELFYGSDERDLFNDIYGRLGNDAYNMMGHNLAGGAFGEAFDPESYFTDMPKDVANAFAKDFAFNRAVDGKIEDAMDVYNFLNMSEDPEGMFNQYKAMSPDDVDMERSGVNREWSEYDIDQDGVLSGEEIDLAKSRAFEEQALPDLDAQWLALLNQNLTDDQELRYNYGTRQRAPAGQSVYQAPGESGMALVEASGRPLYQFRGH